MIEKLIQQCDPAEIQAEGYGTIADHDPALGFWNTVEEIVEKHGHTAASISKGYVKVSTAVDFQHLFLDILEISPYIAQEFMTSWKKSSIRKFRNT